MVKRKIVRPKKKRAADENEHIADDAVTQGVWGLVYSALGALILISALFYLLLAPDAHPLGPFLGARMAAGMFYILGHLATFAFAAAVCYIGAAKLLGKTLRLKLLLFIAILTVQVSFLLAVLHMPQLKADGLTATADAVGSNFIGLMLTSVLTPIFGGRTFGPYFIGIMLLAITIILTLQVKPQNIITAMSQFFSAAISHIKKVFADVASAVKNSPPIISPQQRDNNSSPEKIAADDNALLAGNLGKVSDLLSSLPPDAENVASGAEPAVENADAQVEERELTPEEEAKKRLEMELSEFRKAKAEPVQILNMGQVEKDEQEEASSEDETQEEEYDVIEDIPTDEIEEEEEEENEEDDDSFKVTELSSKPYVVPSPDIIPDPPPLADMVDREAIEHNRTTLEKTLMNFGVEGTVRSVCPGPVVARYEIVLAPGIKVSKVTSLQEDISLAVSGQKIRIQAPIPGKAAIGIELPNAERQFVHFKHILESDKFKKSKAKIPIVIGSDISGAPYVADIQITPHLLIAGQTGAGKSVCMNSLICSLLMTKKPEELRLIMIDPKQVEFAPFENIPHLLAPVVTESKEAVKALQWGVMEMERRYTLFKDAGVRKIEDFNERFDAGELADVLPPETNKHLPYIVIIVDELADLMMTAPKDVESLIMRIAQKARAAGIHLVLATQRPSVNVITGPIKANLPSRIAFRTVSAVDSRTILDQGGAEKLLGKGDMLFLLNGAPDIERLHGAFIPDRDVKTIVTTIIAQGAEVEDKINSFHEIIKDPEEDATASGDDGGARDEHFAEAARITVSIGQGSTSLLQRRMNIGFARAGRIMDQLERAGIVGPQKGSKTREVLITPEELDDILQA